MSYRLSSLLSVKLTGGFYIKYLVIYACICNMHAFIVIITLCNKQVSNNVVGIQLPDRFLLYCCAVYVNFLNIFTHLGKIFNTQILLYMLHDIQPLLLCSKTFRIIQHCSLEIYRILLLCFKGSL